MLNRRAQPVTITVPKKMLAMADKIAKREGRTRSEVFREAIRAYFWKRRWDAVQAYGALRAKETGVKEKDIEGIVDEVRDARRS
ncbi:MAG: CopG family transcriptional regulator [Elusimicrobia bacterium CG_4_9_14_3_um_filter_62_55]|nr:MAG: CopG family transcriptional regulator [Elusimicrobia bacterium CG22_combo_CG10-13_8_21_14_all_63_91]PJB24299.1 MAG: CopG family transcriptional regulator [Elusimicrobia bacterium CG_4_9_14_3_um_filter_62_55]